MNFEAVGHESVASENSKPEEFCALGVGVFPHYLLAMESVTILQNISDVAQITTAIASLAIAWMVYRWTQNVEKSSQARQLNLEMQSFNQMVLSDPELLAIEANNHPPELGGIDTEQARRMYLYFCWINMADNIVRARDQGLMDSSLASARLSNLSRILASDSEFIRQHVLPRGYIAQPVIKELTQHWPPQKLNK